MDDKTVREIAFANLPGNVCALSRKHTDDPVVMHRDLSDWWPPSLQDMRDERVRNLIIVDREMRDHYYAKLKQTGVVLSLSGGLDSTTVLAWCMHTFGKVHCLLFHYGQRHKIELKAAADTIEIVGSQNPGVLTWEVVDMSPINHLGGSALTRPDVAVPQDRSTDEMTSSIPSTFVPGRNVYFMTAIAQAAYARGWRHIALGVNVLDYSGYPDCRPEFLDAMRTALRLGIFNGIDVGVHAPLMFLNKKQIIRLGLYLDVDYANTVSCYNGDRRGCGRCDSCTLRQKAFKELGMIDPAIGNREQ